MQIALNWFYHIGCFRSDRTICDSILDLPLSPKSRRCCREVHQTEKRLKNSRYPRGFGSQTGPPLQPTKLCHCGATNGGARTSLRLAIAPWRQIRASPAGHQKYKHSSWFTPLIAIRFDREILYLKNEASLTVRN